MLFGNVRDMSTAKFCTQCGTQIDQGDKFCKSCGVRISDFGASEPRPKNPVPQVKEELHLTRDGLSRGKKKKTFSYLQGCLLVLSGIVVGFFAFGFALYLNIFSKN